MTSKRRASGFSRRFADVPIIVNKPYDKYFSAENWTVLSENEVTTTFEYSCPNRYAGDDESVVHSPWINYPEGFDPMGNGADQVTIDCGNGVY